jgi:hypothetical protein
MAMAEQFPVMAGIHQLDFLVKSIQAVGVAVVLINLLMLVKMVAQAAVAL